MFFISTSIYRVDFGLGKLGFRLVPSLLLSPLILLFSLKKGVLSMKLKSLWVIVFLFYLLCLISLIHLQSFLQIKRFFLLGVMLLTTGSALSLFNFVQDKNLFLKRFVKYSLVIYAIFSFGEACYFIKGQSNLQGGLGFLNLIPSSVGSIFPRLQGAFIDSNLSGYFLVFLFFFSIYLRLNSRYRYVIITFIILTLSRSAVASFFICYFGYLIVSIKNFEKYRWRKKSVYRFGLALLLTIVMGTMFLPKTKILFLFQKAVSTRINEKGSAGIHFALVKYGLKTILGNPIYFTFGHGFASSNWYLTKKFSKERWAGRVNIKYLNFHSEFITIVFEMGVIGFFIYILLFLIPIGYSFFLGSSQKITLGLILISFLLENVFYQQYLFWYYWLAIYLVWYFLFSGTHVFKGITQQNILKG